MEIVKNASVISFLLCFGSSLILLLLTSSLKFGQITSLGWLFYLPVRFSLDRDKIASGARINLDSWIEFLLLEVVNKFFMPGGNRFDLFSPCESMLLVHSEGYEGPLHGLVSENWTLACLLHY